MSSMRKFTEQQIVNHRNQEQRTNQLESKLKSEFYSKTQAQWESKGESVSKKNFIDQSLKSTQEKSRQKLEERRNRLAILL